MEKVYATHFGLDEFVEKYPWESDAQKKGFGALLKDLREKTFPEARDLSPADRLEHALSLVACFFIQKDHDSNEWYNERFGNLDSRIREDLVRLQEENRALRGDIEELKQALLKT